MHAALKRRMAHGWPYDLLCMGQGSSECIYKPSVSADLVQRAILDYMYLTLGDDT